MTGHILAIDQGTTSTRAIVFDGDLRPVAISQREFPQHFPAPGWVEHGPEDLVQTTIATCRDAIAQAGVTPAAIGITNQRETVVVWDRITGKPVANAIVWQDRRTSDVCATLRADGIEPGITERTGLLLDPYFSATKIAWLLDNTPGAREAAEDGHLLAGTVDTWLIWRLTGGKVHATDATNASRTMLFNIHALAWDADLCDTLRVPGLMLPDVRDCADDFGTTDPAVFGHAIPILGVAGDQQAATIGQACFAPGMMKSTYGTGCFALLNTGDTPVASKSRLLTTLAYQLDGRPTYALEGSIFIAGAVVQWLRDGLQILETADQSGALAEQADPDQRIYLVPAFTGLGAPYWDADCRGAIHGLTRATGRAELARAALESVAYQTRDLARRHAARLGRLGGHRPARRWRHDRVRLDHAGHRRHHRRAGRPTRDPGDDRPRRRLACRTPGGDLPRCRAIRRKLGARPPLRARNGARRTRPALCRLAGCCPPNPQHHPLKAREMDRETAWSRVMDEAERLRPIHLRTLFADDAGRFRRFSVRHGDMTVDFSKEKIDPAAFDALLTLARAAGVEAARDAMYRGEHVNVTEDRPAIHTAVRSDDPPAEIEDERARMLDFAEAVRTGGAPAADGGPFTDVVNLGIGGSDLGPAMVTGALAPWVDGPRVHYVSNVDGAHFGDVAGRLDPARTLVIVASKSFTTLETLSNGRLARAWLAHGGVPDGDQMAAVTANPDRAAEQGFAPGLTFRLWDGVGGRFSVWSSVGLPLAIAVGADSFLEFLDGAAAMDHHHAEAPLEQNLPVLMALIGIWRRNAMGWPALALLPYDQRLSRFPAYLQQLDMESNGKSRLTDGGRTRRATAPVLFGEPGTNSQHSFFQMLHQGTDVVPADFLVAAEPVQADPGAHRTLVASALAQSSALAFGTLDTADPQRTFHGDRPSTVILYRRLDPATLGALIALYEHKVTCQATIWGINPFDQFGVELGKTLTARLLPAMEKGDLGGFDLSTAGLAGRIAELRRRED